MLPPENRLAKRGVQNNASSLLLRCQEERQGTLHTLARNDVAGGFVPKRERRDALPPSLVDFMALASKQAGLAARQGLHVGTHLQS